MSIASASPEPPTPVAPAAASALSAGTSGNTITDSRDRMATYKALSVAFAYPEEYFFRCFPQLTDDRDELTASYDRLFRTGAVWLYSAEHLAENEFQRVDYLADISGFYRAFGLQPGNDRPDALTSELEFMYYLIFKWHHAVQAGGAEHADVCLDAQRKFFAEHLFPGAVRIARSIVAKHSDGFYATVACEMLEFLACENELLGIPGSLGVEA